MRRENKYIALFLVLMLACTGFIFNNSLKDSEESYESSNKVVEIVEPIIGEVNSEKGLDFWVRKSAHVIEFALLGLVSAALTLVLQRRFGCHLFGYCLFYVILVAVTDEFIQSYMVRTSSVKDIFIDSGFW